MYWWNLLLEGPLKFSLCKVVNLLAWARSSLNTTVWLGTLGFWDLLVHTGGDVGLGGGLLCAGPLSSLQSVLLTLPGAASPVSARLLPLRSHAPGVMPSVTPPSQVCRDTPLLLARVAFPSTSSEFPPPPIQPHSGVLTTLVPWSLRPSSPPCH